MLVKLMKTRIALLHYPVIHFFIRVVIRVGHLISVLSLDRNKGLVCAFTFTYGNETRHMYHKITVPGRVRRIFEDNRVETLSVILSGTRLFLTFYMSTENSDVVNLAWHLLY